MIIRMPSPALRARILAAGEMGPLAMSTLCVADTSPQHRPTTAEERAAVPAGACLFRRGGAELSESERIRVLGLLAADDAEPFAKTDRA
jgi:hypothetical protein